MDSSCCPKDSFPYLQADHRVQGEYLSAPFLAGTEKDDEKAVDFFAVGKVEKGGKAIVFIGDVWGWNTGRIRPIAEFFAQQGYYCVVPKLLVPALEGGCDGDGLPPNFEMGKRGGDFVAWIKTIPFEGAVKPRMAAVLAYLKGEEVSKIGMVGFCWGGWCLFHTAAAFPSDVTCGCVPHPSVTLEGRVYGGEDVMLSGKVTCPILLMPAGNDPDTYRAAAEGREEGKILAALKKNNAKSMTLSDPFLEVTHGWSVRGDTKDEKIAKATTVCMDAMVDFFASNL